MQFHYPHVFTQNTTRQPTIRPRPVVFEPGQSIVSITGDCIDVLPEFPPDRVNCMVTSPPYYGLRDYDLPKTRWPEVRYSPMSGFQYFTTTIPAMTCCLGLEPTPEAYIGHLVHVFRLVRRVLRDDGTCWVNIGDSYAGGGGYCPGAPSNQYSRAGQRGEAVYGVGMGYKPQGGIKAKDLMMIPARLALALQADGWILRSDIVWHKKNPLPESVTDRPTKSHEYIYLLSKQARYWYDAEAIREKNSPTNTRGNRKAFRGNGDYTNNNAYAGKERTGNKVTGNDGNLAAGRNKRTVWTVNTRGYPAAHFAVYPPELIEPCILAGCPPEVCSECGAPYVRDIKSQSRYEKREPAHVPNNTSSKVDSTGWKPPIITDNGFKPACDCGHGSHPGIVLDPFAGTGTTGRVAVKHRRRAILIDLSEDYRELQRDRTEVQVALPGVVA